MAHTDASTERDKGWRSFILDDSPRWLDRHLARRMFEEDDFFPIPVHNIYLGTDARH